MADIYELAVENGYLAAAVMELQDSTRTEYDKKLGWCYLRSDYSGRDWMEPIPLAYINDSEQDGLITDLLDWDCTPEDYDWDGEDIDDVKEWLYENLFDMILDKLSGQKANESCNEGFDMLSDMEKWLKELLDDGVKMTKFSAAQRLASHFPGASEGDIQKVVKKMKLKESKGKGMIDVLGDIKEDLSDRFIAVHDKDEYNWNLHHTDYTRFYDILKKYLKSGETFDAEDEDGYPLKTNVGLKTLFSRMPKFKQKKFMKDFDLHHSYDFDESCGKKINESRELDRKLFVSLIAYGDKPYEGYGVLNDGYFVKKIYADSDEEAISKFRSWLSNPDDE